MKNLIDPCLAGENKSLAGDNCRADDIVGIEQCCSQITVTDVFCERVGDVAMCGGT